MFKKIILMAKNLIIEKNNKLYKNYKNKFSLAASSIISDCRHT
jgi:hypothetical protein